jgi:hypothetical protein
MIIILKNIPAKIQKQDIKNFIMPIVKGGWFSKRGQINSIVILAQKNIRTHIIEYHCLVGIHPNVVAERVIKKLHRKIIAGKYIAISEYKIRDWHNDKRLGKPITQQIRNRRLADRRDEYEEISKDAIIGSKLISHAKG